MDSLTNTPRRRLRLYGPSLITLAVLLPFFAYYIRQVKSQQVYLNDHTFRVLDVIAEQFGDYINGAHDTMEAAVQLPSQDCDLRPKHDETCTAGSFDPEEAINDIRGYLQTYITHGDVSVQTIAQPKDNAGMERHSIWRAEDSEIFVQLLHVNQISPIPEKPAWVEISARVYPEKVLGLVLQNDKKSLFDSVFVAERSGRVLAQSSDSKLDVNQLQTLLDSRQIRDIVEGTKNTKGGDDVVTPAQISEVSGADQRLDVNVAGTDYVLFAVPAPFVLYDEDKETNVAFYALIRKDTLDSKALQMPLLGMPAIALGFIIGMAFFWPVLKLYTMSDRERLTKSSVALMSGITVIAAFLLAALYLTVGFDLAESERRDQALQELSQRIQEHFSGELRQGIDTSRDLMTDLIGRAGSDPGTSWPRDARFAISALTDTTPLKRYPFFKHVILTGVKPGLDSQPGAPIERQIMKISASMVPTPLITLPDSRFPIVGQLKHSPSSVGNDSFAIDALISPNTGEFLPTVLFPKDPGPRFRNRSLFRIMLSTELPSLVNVVFPPGFGFAVLNQSGTVIFDSDSSRNLRENFLNECEDPTALRDVLRLNQQKFLALNYSGGPVRAFVRPLDGSVPLTTTKGSEALANLHRYLIVYGDQNRQDKMVSTIGKRFLAGTLGVPLLGVLFVIAGVLFVRTFQQPSNIKYIQKRIWPWEAEKASYVSEGLWGLACFLCASIAALLSPPVWTPWVLNFFLVVCGAGFGYSLLNKGLFKSPAFSDAVEHVPLVTAYAARLFGIGLGVIGIVSLLIFQLVLTSAQVGIENDDYRTLRSAIERRTNQISRDYQSIWAQSGADRSGPEKPVAPAMDWKSFCGARIQPGFDVYDHRQVAGSKVFTALDSKRRGLPIEHFALPTPLPECPGGAAGSNSEEPMGFEAGELWQALPGRLAGHWPRRETAAFYVAGFLLLLPVFLWLRLIIGRLFSLDFAEPEPLLPRGAFNLGLRMESKLMCRELDRLMIFAHPQSGSGLALDNVVATLKHDKVVPAKYRMFDFGNTAGMDSEDAAKIRKAVVEESGVTRIAILDNFEVQITDPEKRMEKLEIVEALVSSHQCSVYLLTSSDPLLLMQSLLRLGPYTPALQAEADRWARVLASFDRCLFDANTPEFFSAVDELVFCLGEQELSHSQEDEYVDIFRAELSPTIFLRRAAGLVKMKQLRFTNPREFEDSLVVQVSELAEGYYRVIWLNCTSDERLAMYQLAKDDWANPLNKVAISHLLRKQLIGKGTPSSEGTVTKDFHYQRAREGAYHLMNLSFRAFVLGAVSDRELAVWEKQQNLSIWPALRTALVLALVLVALFVAYVRRDVFDVYFSYFAALAGGGAALVRIILQFFSKDDPKAAALGVGKKGEDAEG